MSIAQVAYWGSFCSAAGLYVCVNVHFIRLLQPRMLQLSVESCSPLAKTVGHWLPQLMLLAGVVLMAQLLVAPLMLAAVALQWLLLVNNRKVALLGEPLLPSDIVMTLNHPANWRLLARYVRYERRTIAFTLAAVAAVVAGCACEPWILGRYRVLPAMLGPLLIVVVFAPFKGGSLMLRLLTAVKAPFWEWEPLETVAAAGFFPTFLRFVADVPRPTVHGMSAAEARSILDASLAPSIAPPARPPWTPPRKPHLVVVMSEAFFDPSSAGLSIEPDPLPNLAQASRRSAFSGFCWVPIYGGWTTRAEYSFLTGISMSCLASGGGNPYTTLLSGRTHTLPKYLKTQGYRTAMIHPYNPQFYGRSKACAALGFDEFLHERHFAGAAREGQFVSDDAVAAKIEEELRRATGPTFLFCITIENHGPWDDESPPATPFTTRPRLSPASRSSFAQYLLHLSNADRMIGRLTEFASKSDDPPALLFLGDHLPALSGMFSELGCPPVDLARQRLTPAKHVLFRTPYFLSTAASPEHREMNCDISLLAGLLLDCARLNGDRFFRENSAMRELTGGNLKNDAVEETIRRAYSRYCYDRMVFPERYASTPPQ